MGGVWCAAYGVCVVVCVLCGVWCTVYGVWQYVEWACTYADGYGIQRARIENMHSNALALYGEHIRSDLSDADIHKSHPRTLGNIRTYPFFTGGDPSIVMNGKRLNVIVEVGELRECTSILGATRRIGLAGTFKAVAQLKA